MPYSDWTDSRWYTYRIIDKENDIESKENEIFVVMPSVCGNTVSEFSYYELKTQMDICLHEVVRKIGLEYQGKGHNLTYNELDELRAYMQMFIEDVDEDWNYEDDSKTKNILIKEKKDDTVNDSETTKESHIKCGYCNTFVPQDDVIDIKDVGFYERLYNISKKEYKYLKDMPICNHCFYYKIISEEYARYFCINALNIIKDIVEQSSHY